MKINIVELAKNLINKDEAFVIAKVIETKGSTPRKKGAWMLVRNDGSFQGTVGGGILELEAQKRALELFKSKKAYIHHFILEADKKQGLDMRCGGDVDIAFEYIDKKNSDKFLNEFSTKSIAYIFGAGHVGLAVEPVLRYVGFETVIIDDREEFVNKERFPKAKEIIKIQDYKNSFSQIEINKDSYIIIVTRGHTGDYEVIKQSLKYDCAYIGMIGSRKKVANTFKKLKEEGISQDSINKVHSPIGLDIKAETPEEIAISIVAEMIKVRAVMEESNDRN